MCSGSLTAGGPEFRVGLLLLLFGSPDLLARVCELPRDPLHLGGYAVESVTQAHVVAKLLETSGLAEADNRRLGVVADDLGLLPHECLDVLVGDLDPELVGHGVENELTSDGARGLV